MKTLTVIHRKSIPFLLLGLILISALLVVCLPNAKAWQRRMNFCGSSSLHAANAINSAMRMEADGLCPPLNSI